MNRSRLPATLLLAACVPPAVAAPTIEPTGASPNPATSASNASSAGAVPMGSALSALPTPAASLGGSSEPPATGWCWKPLPQTEKEELALVNTSFAATAVGADLWLAANWAPHLLRFRNGAWSTVPSPASGEPLFGGGAAILHASPKGGLFLASRGAGDSQSTTAIAVSADASSWKPLGIANAHPERFTNGSPMGIGTDRAGNPIIAWSEVRPPSGGGGPRDLWTARFDGAKWIPHGPPVDENVFEYDPASFAIRQGSPWLAWTSGDDPRATTVNVARLTKGLWIPVALPDGFARGCKTGRRIELVTDREGRLWASWLETCSWKAAAARLVEGQWQELAVPSEPNESASSIHLAPLADGSLVLARARRAEKGAIGDLRVDQLTSQGWRSIAPVMQLDHGQSDATTPRIVPRGAGFFLMWDERGADGRRTRGVTFDPCGAGERPVAVLPSKKRDEFWPKTVDEAATVILARMDDTSKRDVRSKKKSELILFHHGWGTGIRNELGLWAGNRALLDSCKAQHPDDCSMVIIERVWERLQNAK